MCHPFLYLTGNIFSEQVSHACFFHSPPPTCFPPSMFGPSATPRPELFFCSTADLAASRARASAAAHSGHAAQAALVRESELGERRLSAEREAHATLHAAAQGSRAELEAEAKQKKQNKAKQKSKQEQKAKRSRSLAPSPFCTPPLICHTFPFFLYTYHSDY